MEQKGNKKDCIPFKPKRTIPSVNIQAEFYRQCISNGISVYLEYKHDNCRFDAVVYEHDEIKFIVEFKSYAKKMKPKLNTRQIKKYESYGIPVILVTRMEDVCLAINQILNK